MKLQIHILTIDASDGQSTTAYSSLEELNAQLYASLKRHWSEVSWHDEVPDTIPADVDEALGFFQETVSAGGGIDTYYYLECEEVEFPEPEARHLELIEALKDMYRLVEGTDGAIYETQNPYGRPQMRRAGKALNAILGLKVGAKDFEQTLFEGKD